MHMIRLARFRPFNNCRFYSTAKNVVDKTISTSRVPRTSKATSPQALRRTAALKFFEPIKMDAQTHLGCPVLPCTVVTTCESYDLAHTVKLLHDSGFKDASLLIPNEAVHFEVPNTTRKMKSDVLVLSTGTVVAWGLDEKITFELVLPLIAKAMHAPVPAESEDMDYLEKESSRPSYVDGEYMVIQGKSQNEKLIEKAAFAFGMARSTRLAILETQLEQFIQQTRQNTTNLSEGKRLGVSGRDLLRYMGQLLVLRGQLNLYSELIETPDLYWSEPNLEKIYKDISRQLDIVPRIVIMNRKLDYATEETRALIATLNEEKGVRLEWIIIYLIMVEVCFEIFHFYDRFKKKDAVELA